MTNNASTTETNIPAMTSVPAPEIKWPEDSSILNILVTIIATPQESLALSISIMQRAVHNLGTRLDRMPESQDVKSAQASHRALRVNLDKVADAVKRGLEEKKIAEAAVEVKEKSEVDKADEQGEKKVEQLSKAVAGLIVTKTAADCRENGPAVVRVRKGKANDAPLTSVVNKRFSTEDANSTTIPTTNVNPITEPFTKGSISTNNITQTTAYAGHSHRREAHETPGPSPETKVMFTARGPVGARDEDLDYLGD